MMDNGTDHFAPGLLGLRARGGGVLPVHRIFQFGMTNYLPAEQSPDTLQTTVEPQVRLHALSAVHTGPVVLNTSGAHALRPAIELALLIGQDSDNIPSETLPSIIIAYAACISFAGTNSVGEGDEGDRPLVFGEAVRAKDLGRYEVGHIILEINNVEKSSGDIAEMLVPISSILKHAVQITPLRTGDVVLTGWPPPTDGSNAMPPARPGDRLAGLISGLPPTHVSIGDE